MAQQMILDGDLVRVTHPVTLAGREGRVVAVLRDDVEYTRHRPYRVKLEGGNRTFDFAKDELEFVSRMSEPDTLWTLERSDLFFRLVEHVDTFSVVDYEGDAVATWLKKMTPPDPEAVGKPPSRRR